MLYDVWLCTTVQGESWESPRRRAVTLENARLLARALVVNPAYWAEIRAEGATTVIEVVRDTAAS